MKKISLVVLALSTYALGFAQNYEKSTPMATATRFGIKGGVNFATVKYESASNSGISQSTEDLAGLNAGLFANIPIGGMLRFQPELVFSGQGSKNSTTVPAIPSGTTTYSTNTRLNYINLPLLLQLQTAGGFFVETGPQLGYLINAKSKGTGSNNNNTEVDIKDNLRTLDFAWAGGIGYLSRIGLGIDARYNFGFRNVYDDENSSNANAGEMKNRVIQFGLFWQFGAGK